MYARVSEWERTQHNDDDASERENLSDLIIILLFWRKMSAEGIISI